MIDKTWGTPPLIWALTRRSEEPDLLDWDKARADPKMLAALTGKVLNA